MFNSAGFHHEHYSSPGSLEDSTFNYILISRTTLCFHDDVIKWKHFPRNWPFVREIHRSPVNFPHKGQWRGALMFSLMYAWINDWVNNREAGDLRLQHGHYDVIVMSLNGAEGRNTLTHWPLGDFNEVFVCNFRANFSDWWLRCLGWK